MKTTLALAVTVLSLTAKAQTYSVGQPAYGGSGCPAGTASIEFSPDPTDFTLLADSFVAQSGERVNRRLDIKSCNLAIPITVEEGYQVALVSDLRLFAHAERGAKVAFFEEIFRAGERGEPIARTYHGPVSQDEQISTGGLTAEGLNWSACGASTNLRANLQLRTQGEALAAIDQVQFKILVRRCE